MREFERQLQHVRDAAATLGVFAVSEGIDGVYPGFGMVLEGMAGSLLDTTRAIDAAGWQHVPKRPVQDTQDATQVDFKAHEEARHRVEGATNMLFGMAESGLAMQPETAAGLQDIAEILSNATCDMYGACHAPDEI
ncbi:MAG: hypothetical protein LKF55_08105 [Atopobiaceae bacterium]|nr:hypothetical protein [Atopobiaceae bacterium]MCI1227364.1 hypothetical protein [Atopobiaceae bacterium]